MASAASPDPAITTLRPARGKKAGNESKTKPQDLLRTAGVIGATGETCQRGVVTLAPDLGLTRRIARPGGGPGQLEGLGDAAGGDDDALAVQGVGGGEALSSLAAVANGRVGRIHRRDRGAARERRRYDGDDNDDTTHDANSLQRVASIARFVTGRALLIADGVFRRLEVPAPPLKIPLAKPCVNSVRFHLGRGASRLSLGGEDAWP
ncbi:hypothetical protein CC_0023 [Caulobacter vibrioides CB15]|uniref:Uncharacterized protein n=1 Tax=Caulobacter vibrioides (strain ATCC 19089 / CIP 103742 / CB 15) TaxID=190650 RepID=Q9AC43_CAUVC|nr:hypothetical protein CC_0023 [Caulobacter vibrioides CB15]